jgi:Arc/MetJ-type ribon-helix-helix transcriptional regulator
VAIETDWMKDQRIPVMMSSEDVAAIDEWRRKNADLPSRSEAIRRLVEIGLKAHTPEPKAVEQLRERVAGAAELAAKAVDSLTVGAANADKKASRKRRLTKGLSTAKGK